MPFTNHHLPEKCIANLISLIISIICPGKPNWQDTAAVDFGDGLASSMLNYCPSVTSTTTVSADLDLDQRAKQALQHTVIGASVGAAAFAALMIFVAFMAIRRAKDELRLASKNRNDPLSRIEGYIAANRENLSESVRATGTFKQKFDILYVNTVMSVYNADPSVLQDLRNVHKSLKQNAAERCNGQELVQPNLGYAKLSHNDEKVRKREQMKYVIAILSVVRKEEPTAAALLEDIAAEHVRRNGGKKAELYRGPIKQLDRILEKGDVKGHHFEKLRDYGRATLCIEDVTQVSVLLQRLDDGPEFEVVRVKNRLDPTYDSIESGGYRDYQLVLRCRPSASVVKEAGFSSPWLFELQIVTFDTFNLKMGNVTSDDGTNAAAAHKAYKDFRKFKELGTRMQHQLNSMHEELSVLETAPDGSETDLKRIDRWYSGYGSGMPGGGNTTYAKFKKAKSKAKKKKSSTIVNLSDDVGGGVDDEAQTIWMLSAKVSKMGSKTAQSKLRSSRGSSTNNKVGPSSSAASLVTPRSTKRGDLPMQPSPSKRKSEGGKAEQNFVTMA